MSLYQRQEAFSLNTRQSISVIGCGGVGYWVAKFAAMSGIEKIYLFDPDRLEDHNLNRIDLPEKFVGMNKAEATKISIGSIRKGCSIFSMPFKLQEHTFPRTDWLVDCTDNYKSQIENQNIAGKFKALYTKVGYDGYGISINDRVAEWGEAEDGYTIEPSWVVPASVIAALAVAKIMRFQGREFHSTIPQMLGEKTPTIKKFRSMEG